MTRRLPRARHSRGAATGCALGVALLWASAIAAGPAAELRLGARLRATGRAECAFVRVATDAWTAHPARVQGRLVLEPPDRARLEFPASGERITLRGDGGEWLQPRLKQLVVFGRERAAGAGRWWQLLIDGASPGIVVTARPGRRLLLRAAAGAGPDSARIDLDGAGLPTRLVVPDAGASVEFRFGRWRFGPPLGAAAFRQSAPDAYERVEMP